MLPLADRYADRIIGTLGCYDRLILIGTLPSVGSEAGMADFLKQHEIPLSQFKAFVMGLRDQLVEHVETLAAAEGVQVEYLQATRKFSKEARVQEILEQRGRHPGLVHIFSVIEPCNEFRVLTNRKTAKPFLKHHPGSRCKHYYFYFIDPQFGLCYLRVPTWVPFRLQFYCNGHSWLACELKPEGTAFTQVDNAFTHIADFARAQQLADAFPVKELHQALDTFARKYCPVFTQLQPSYHWSIMQAEYATDLIFRDGTCLQPLYAALSRLAVCVVKAADIATFVGRPLSPEHLESANSRFQTYVEGTRVRHQLGPVSLKMYDKHWCILRIETTVNDVSFFRIHREVAHLDGTRSVKLADLKKEIYSLRLLDSILAACNRRYLDFLSALVDPTAGVEQADRLGEPARDGDRTYRGFNLFAATDRRVLEAVARPEWAIRGFTNKLLRRTLTPLSGAQASRILKRLRLHGLIERFTRSYRYRLTPTGQQVVLAGLKLHQLVVIPALAGL